MQNLEENEMKITKKMQEKILKARKLYERNVDVFTIRDIDTYLNSGVIPKEYYAGLVEQLPAE
jgi:hypothetical protein